MSSLHARKITVREFLSHRDLTGVRRWAASERSPLRTLLSLTFDGQELIRWRAVEAVGPVAADQARLDLDRVRDFMRRLLWLMNDESGGLSWLSPEMIGEILVNVPTLIEEYGPLLPSFLQEEPFERGSHLAIWRVAGIRSELFKKTVLQLRQSLGHPDPGVRALAAVAIMTIDSTQSGALAVQFSNDEAGFALYDFTKGEMQQTTVARMVARFSDARPRPEWAA